MIIQKALLSAVSKLKKQNQTSAHLDAEVLLAFVTKKQKTYLLSNIEKRLTVSQVKKFNSLISKRQRGMPVAYLTNHKEFYGLDFYITRDVLIPRPETELLVETAIKAARQLYKTADEPVVIADIGTGCGNIAITLAKYLPFSKLIATDISKKAIEVAKKNARHHKVLKRITFKKGDLLKPLKKFKPNIIVANLPYLTKDELANVRHEPKQALYGGKMGLVLIQKLLSQAPKVLARNGIILLEISPAQVKAINYFVEQHLPEKIISTIEDLAGRDRVVKIK